MLVEKRRIILQVCTRNFTEFEILIKIWWKGISQSSLLQSGCPHSQTSNSRQSIALKSPFGDGSFSYLVVSYSLTFSNYRESIHYRESTWYPSSIRHAPSTGSLPSRPLSLFFLLSLNGQSCVSSSIPLSIQLNFEVLFPSKRRLDWPRPEIPLQEGRGLRACLCLAVLPSYRDTGSTAKQPYRRLHTVNFKIVHYHFGFFLVYRYS